MVTKAELLTMPPREVFRQAQRAGLHNARILQSLGVKPDAVSKWYKARPQYNNPGVQVLMDKGDKQASKEILGRIR
ncbi:MAG: hypothetical protein AAB662_02615, partial [Patescibacteria group bacterium]